MGDGQINTDYLRYEWYRLQSFSNVEANQSVSLLRLARDGFYHTGQANIVKCCFCGFEWPDWSDGKIPDHCVERNQNIPIHADRSILVPSGQCLSGPTPTHFHYIIRPQNVVHERSLRATDYYRQNLSERLNTDSNGHNENPSSCESLRKKSSSNGSRQTQRQNEEQNNSNLETAVEIQGCADSTQSTNYARRKFTESKISHDIEKNGRLKSCTTRTSTTPVGPQCSTRNRNTSVNHTIVSTEDSSERSQMSSKPCKDSVNGALRLSGIKPHLHVSPVKPQLSKGVKKCTGVPRVYKDRLATFQGVSLPQPSDILAANGFYYIRSSVAVKCAHCEEVWNVKDSRQSSNTVHKPDCKFHLTQEESESSETSSQPNSMSDTDVSSLPAVQEVKQFGFHTPDIVNAYREISSDSLDFRCITQTHIMSYFYEDDKDEESPEEDGIGCACCKCLRDVISELYLPCLHGCCCDCKSRVLLHCPKCDAIIKSKLDIYT